MSKRIGIFSGSFDPIHNGHVAFALSAIAAAKLDAVYFAPETKPRRKPHVTHIAHRLAMLELALRSQPRLHVLELPGKYFLPKSTMAHIRKKFPNDEIVILLGSDLFEHLTEYPQQWPHVEYLLSEVGFAVASREGHSPEEFEARLLGLPVQPRSFVVAENHEPALSSGLIRQAMVHSEEPVGLARGVHSYAKKHWLYYDLSRADKNT